jgi:TPR repeat protein
VIRRAIVLVSLAAACRRFEEPPVPVATIAQRVAASAWQRDTAKCPTDVMTGRDQDLTYLGRSACRGAEMSRCLKRCDDGDGGWCYWLAIGLQESRADPAAEALFMRACGLGIVSGCTNRAAGMLMKEDPDSRTQQCAARTFDKACDLDDPWACTMYATQLLQGTGVPKNEVLALSVLKKSCKYGPDDPACINARKLRAKIEGQ